MAPTATPNRLPCPLCNDHAAGYGALRRHLRDDHEPLSVLAITMDGVAAGVAALIPAIRQAAATLAPFAAGMRTATLEMFGVRK
jgi:hypothetical protein